MVAATFFSVARREENQVEAVEKRKSCTIWCERRIAGQRRTSTTTGVGMTRASLARPIGRLRAHRVLGLCARRA